ncbi:CBS domain-containing protein [Actinomadura craniellae]|uniref:CBS domain-containing protein n=1 Tax=Actinomadura craniellae TaxID=2231787 RepID=A0A365GXC6_9ACTN|nr:CBS domain-containing protein [Actinomadura craniellae]RAY11489.1 CBS domain-containing protein [Actinomadura craniellae]
MAQKVREVMTGAPVTVRPDADLRTVARLMRDEGVGDVLVTTDDDRLRGLVTDRDLVVRAMAEGGDPEQTAVSELCSGHLAAVAPDDDLKKVVQLMREHSVRRIPVVEDERPVGVVSLGDLAIERDEGSALADISAAKTNR